MTVMLEIVVAVLLAPSLFVACTPLFIARMFARRRTRDASAGPAGGGTASVIVPCRGLESPPGDNAAALLAQSFPYPVEILFCVEAADDPVVAVLQPLLKARVDGAARLVVTGPAGSDLGKMHNLIGGLAVATGSRLVFLDSDVRLPDRDYLRRFVSGLDEPGTGLVTCFPAYRQCANIPAAIVAAMVNLDLLGLFAFVGLRGNLSLANGSCLAATREAVEAAGGLGALRTQLLMDTALARGVLRAGLRVHLHNEAAPVVAGRMTVAQWRQQSRRWHLAMWRVLPRAQYVGFAWLRSSLLLLALVWALAGGRPLPAVALAAGLAVRGAVMAAVDRRYLRSRSLIRYGWLLPVVEVINGWDALTAPFAREIRWRGTRYHVNREGRATPLAIPTAPREGT
jgi:ceramide glucosyltransferase